ncbi:MAG: glycosyltransferase family 4 protein [Actinobacteria bacterium]|nr:glycosyltransferase family 4 protein [Actinomycetota bacterium]
MKPVLFLTGHLPDDRVGAFRELHARAGIEVALYGGPHAHGAPPARGPLDGVPHRAPRTPAHLAAYPLMVWIYRDADAVVTYGEHVSGYVGARGARNVHVAPQSVDNALWSAGVPDVRPPGPFRALFVGRPTVAKGLGVLLEAWRASGLAAGGATLTLAGPGVGAPDAGEVGPLPTGVRGVGVLEPAALRNFYGAYDVLVMPSIPTRGFLEPWGLVANEAMNQATAIISTDAVGAAAGGLVRDGRNGLVVPAGDPAALGAALVRLAGDPGLCARLGRAGARDVRAFTHAAWAAGFVGALRSVGVGADPLVALPDA